VQVEKDGTVIVAVGNTEMGQGARSSLCQIAAEALGAPFEAVRLLDIDTTRVPDSGPTVASRTTLMSGNAILDAARPIRETLAKVAAEVLGVAPGDVIVDARGYRADGGERLSFERVTKEAYARRLPVATQGWTVAAPTSFDENGQGDAYVVYAFSVNVAEVEVDLETFETRVVAVTSVHDIGRVVNPGDAEGQVEGGVVQGMGYALCEEVVIDGAAVKNGNFTGYILPTMADSPEIRVRFVEAPYSAGPYGAKGLAETPIVGPAPAIANAIRDAVGVAARRLPITPERLAEMVWEVEKKRREHAPQRH
jgi:CO/xanthine dehydrogenase Mo-binding subunit